MNNQQTTSRKPIATSKAAPAIALIILSLVSSYAFAEKTVAREKVFIDADHVTMNINSGSSSYSGNVRITQGELSLTGDRVIIIQNNNEIERMTVTGKPARYNHVTEDGQKIKAESEQMVYTVSENKLVLTTNARLEQPDHKVSSQKITYDTAKKIIIAGDTRGKGEKPGQTKSGDASHTGEESQRVNITLTPKSAIQPASDATGGDRKVNE